MAAEGEIEWLCALITQRMHLSWYLCWRCGSQSSLLVSGKKYPGSRQANCGSPGSYQANCGSPRRQQANCIIIAILYTISSNHFMSFKVHWSHMAIVANWQRHWSEYTIISCDWAWMYCTHGWQLEWSNQVCGACSGSPKCLWRDG